MYGVGRVMLALNVERAAEARGNDTLLVRAWDFAGLFVDRIVDPYDAWILWLSLGAIMGFHLCTFGLRFEAKLSGRQGGPPFWYLWLQAKSVRFGIRHRWYQRINRDLDSNFEILANSLTQIHGLPEMPATSFMASDDDLILTSEYLRLVIPHLSSANIGEARSSAMRYNRLSRASRLARLAS